MKNITDYLKVFKNINNGPRITAQEPRNMELAGGYGSSTFDAHTKREAAFKAYKNYKKSYYSGRQRSPIISFRQFLPIYAKENYAEGGEVGQLVRNTADGSRPGYRGEDKITKLAKEYQKITGSETSLSNIKSRVRNNAITEDLITKYKRRGPYGSGFRGKEIEAVTNPKFYKIVLSELNKVKKQRNKNVFFDYDDVIKTGKWYKNLRTRLGNLNNVDTDTIVKKVLSEEFPGSYYGKTAMRDFRRDKVVKAYLNYLDVNGSLDGGEKRLKELKIFQGTGKKQFRNINETFKEWTKGEFEVEGIDRKKLSSDQLKELKNWSPEYSTIKSVANEKQLKFLNDLNTSNPNLSPKEVRQRFFKKFPDVTEGAFNHRITHLTQLKNSGAYNQGGGATKTFKWIVPDKNRSPWLKELLGLKFQGNYSSFINRGDKLLARGLTEEADRLYAAAEKYFGSNGIFTKYEGQGEHPFSRIFGSGPIGNELKINSLVRGDLNSFKRLNFDEPVIQLLTEYNTGTTTNARRNEIKRLIEDRKKLMNYLTESPNEKGIVESVKFNYGPKKMTVSANVVDIDKVKNFNVDDYVKRGESYLEAFKTKGAGLFDESGNIIRQKLDEKAIGKFLNNFWCGKKQIAKAGGGRIGFSGSCPVEVKQKNFLRMTNDVRTGKITGEAAEQIAKNAGKVVAKAGSKSALASIFGPAGIGIDIAYEVGSVGIDMYAGKPWKEAVQDNWIAGAFMPGTGQEEFHRRLFEEYPVGYPEEDKTKKYPEAKPYGSGLDLIDAYNKKQKQIDRLEADTTARGRAEAEKRLPGLERDLRGIAASYNALGNVMQPGSPEYENYMAAVTEARDADKAKSGASAAKLKMELDRPISDRYKPELKSDLKIDFELPPNYTTFKPDLPTKERVTEYFKEEGYDISPQEADEIRTREKWRQLFEQPGIRGTQDWRGAGGGMVGIRKPNALPPTGGPQSGGLPSLYNNVRKL